jgi:hypothetical protein
LWPARRVSLAVFLRGFVCGSEEMTGVYTGCGSWHDPSTVQDGQAQGGRAREVGLRGVRFPLNLTFSPGRRNSGGGRCSGRWYFCGLGVFWWGHSAGVGKSGCFGCGCGSFDGLRMEALRGVRDGVASCSRSRAGVRVIHPPNSSVLSVLSGHLAG